MSPREKAAGIMAFCMVSVTTWALAGRASWAPLVFTVLSISIALAITALSRREGMAFNRMAFLPFLLFGLLVAASLLNPSHSPDPDRAGQWMERGSWLHWLPGTVDPSTTLTKVLPWLAALLLGGALRQAALGKRAVRLLWGALLIHGLVVAVVGSWFYFDNNALILGLYPDRHGYHFASFIYRNHWAAYVILLVALALGFAFSALSRWSTERGRLDAVLPGLGAALLIALTLPMPGSRSGMLVVTALLLGAFVRIGWVLWTARTSRNASSTRLIPLFCFSTFLVLTIGVGLMLNHQAIRPHWARTKSQIHRFNDGQSDLRWNLTRDTLKMALDRPIWGWGVGSYGIIFPQYQGDYLRDANGQINARVVHAHNDWAHLWAETGLVGLLILVTPVVALLRRTWATRRVLWQWGGGGVVLILVYALADFPLHCPAVLFLWVTVLCTAAPRRHRDSGPA